jgi:hypothetical protein
MTCGWAVKKRRDMSWDNLQKQYKERGLVLVLGAGVSYGCGIPTWQSLLQRIAGRILGDEIRGREIVSELSGYGFTYPAVASVLEGMYSGSKFKDLVRDELYKGFPFRKGVNRASRADFVKYVQEQNPTLAAIASLCAFEVSPSVFVRNPRVHSIVNFNLDSILRTYMYERYRGYLLRSIERASKVSDLKKISVYYMHGFLRFDLSERDPSEEAADKMVFTEKEYFDFFNKPTNLFSYTFLYLLREYPCLFVGLSMIDENIRRLMHYSQAERESAYREERRRPRKQPAKHFVVLEKRGREIDFLVDRSVRLLGSVVLWVRSYAELPDRISELYRSAGDDWTGVR